MPRERAKQFLPAGGSARFEEKVRQARLHGAAAVLLVTDPVNHLDPAPRRYGLPAVGGFVGEEADPDEIPALFVTIAMAEALLRGSDTTLDRLQRRIDESLEPASFLIPGARVTIDHPLERDRVVVRNVVGVVPGSDPDLAAECVVIGAHYDHEGIKGGDLYPGADDNASGTSTLLEVAEAFASLPPESRPRRSIRFMAFAAEERGLLGSRWTVENPLVPLETIDARVAVGGAAIWPRLGEICEVANRLDRRIVDPGPSDRDQLSKRSDHASFFRGEVPVLAFKASQNPQYHTPGDTLDRIAFSRMERVGRFVFHVAHRIAEMSERPQFQAPEQKKGGG
jgi:hypothetical protein